MKHFLLTTIAIVIIGTGCELKFGDDIELIAPNVTSKEMTVVTERTGIQFPIGATGLGYVFFGSGIDDALAIKVLIPNENQSDFLKNDLFQSGNKDEPSVQIGRNQDWWKLNELNKREDYAKQLPKGKYVACSFGKENGNLIAYISWMST